VLFLLKNCKHRPALRAPTPDTLSSGGWERSPNGLRLQGIRTLASATLPPFRNPGYATGYWY